MASARQELNYLWNEINTTNGNKKSNKNKLSRTVGAVSNKWLLCLKANFVSRSAFRVVVTTYGVGAN